VMDINLAKINGIADFATSMGCPSLAFPLA
jgi:hypothetical protein